MDATVVLQNKFSLCLNQRQLCDLECLLNGAFYPLKGFLEFNDYESVCQSMRLANNTLWPIPVTLDVSESFAQKIQLGECIVLTNEENMPLAHLKITSIWRIEKELEAKMVFGTLDKKHPAVDYLYNSAGEFYLGGEVSALSPLFHYDFLNYRHTPDQLKQLFRIYGWSKIIAFQTRNPIHRAHFELTQRAAKACGAKILLHPVVGKTKDGDVDYRTRVHCYEAVLEEYPQGQAMLSLLPLAMRMAGPREALWHAIIRKNYGVTHFIIGRDHAGPGFDTHGRPFYDPYAAQTLVVNHIEEIGLEILTFPAMVYVKEKNQFCTETEISPNDTVYDISGTELRTRLQNKSEIPSWFTFPSILKLLQQAYPAKLQQGFTLLLTGLSGAGKSSIAKALKAQLVQSKSMKRKVSILDGDIVRHNLSSELGFSKKDRDTHILRVGYVASEITKHGGIAIIAAIAPYSSIRQQIRKSISQFGGFIEIHVSTPLEICKQRDTKGLYAKAELGLLKGFTGVNDPYEIPENPELIIDTTTINLLQASHTITNKLIELGYLEGDSFTLRESS